MNQTENKSKDESTKQKNKKNNPLLSNTDLTQSLIQRFTYRYQQASGQANYNFTDRNPHKTIQDHLQSNREYLWITDKGRQLFQTKSFWKNHLGPGKYPSFCPIERHHSNWSKSKRFNYQKTEAANQVGPGLYQTGINQQIKHRIGASSAFKSKTTKSYLADKIIQIRKNQQPIPNPEVQFQPIETQAYFENENHYQRIQSNKKIKGSPVFLSKCERLPTIQASNVGPGSYILQQTRKKSPERIKRIATEPRAYLTKENLMKKDQSQVQIIAGAESCANIGELQQIKRKALLGVMMRDKRFRQISKKCPGPGDYEVIKNIAKTQNNVSNPQSYQKLRGTDRLVGSVVKKALNRNLQNLKSQSQINVFKLFKHFSKEKESFEDPQKQR